MQSPNLVDLLCFDATRYYNLPARGVIGIHKQSYGLGGADEAVNLAVVAEPDWLPIGNSKVDARDWPLIPTIQFSEPLM